MGEEFFLLPATCVLWSNFGKKTPQQAEAETFISVFYLWYRTLALNVRVKDTVQMYIAHNIISLDLFSKICVPRPVVNQIFRADIYAKEKLMTLHGHVFGLLP